MTENMAIYQKEHEKTSYRGQGLTHKMVTTENLQTRTRLFRHGAGFLDTEQALRGVRFSHKCFLFVILDQACAWQNATPTSE